MGKLELLNRAILEKNETYIENEIKFLLGIQEHSPEDFDIIFKLINYVKWNSHYSTETKNKYLNELSVIFIEKYSDRDYKYSDVLTTYIECLFALQQGSKKDKLNVIHRALSLCRFEDYDKYHFSLYLGLQKYWLGEESHLSYLSESGKIFRKYAKEKKYGNHNLRGLQFMISRNDIEQYSKSEKLNITYHVGIRNQEGAFNRSR